MAAHLLASIAFGLVTVGAGKTALLVIDVQDCYLEEGTRSGKPGSWAAAASHIIPLINAIRKDKSCLFDEVIFTRDYHPANHISFASTHGLEPFAHQTGRGGLPLKCIGSWASSTPATATETVCCPGYYLNPGSYNCSSVLCPPDGWDYGVENSELVTDNPACSVCEANPEDCYDTEQAMWPDHCLQSGDSAFPTSLDIRGGDIFLKKGTAQFVDSYSAFVDSSDLDTILRERDVDTVYVAGVATDHTVHWTVRDALGNSTGGPPYSVKVIKDATAAMMGPAENYQAALQDMEAYGALLVTTGEVLQMVCAKGPMEKAQFFGGLAAVVGVASMIVGAVSK